MTTPTLINKLIKLETLAFVFLFGSEQATLGSLMKRTHSKVIAIPTTKPNVR